MSFKYWGRVRCARMANVVFNTKLSLGASVQVSIQ
ncbi:predicted protein [Botrytis cinerea T4]|uniref:Uncharacterized protein n=1 Tax=Botryotinia fuckeliana (strain T4) TaxID=999810 RepID=G2XSE1_BOTF4|nr:predicted protein [Botrytis cinerea T4]